MPWPEILLTVAEAQALEGEDGAGGTVKLLQAILAAVE